MTAEGFLNQRQRHPIAMTAAVSINLAAVAALMLAKSDWVPPVPNVIWARHIPMPQPKPDEVKQPEQKKQPATKPTPYTPDRQVETDTSEPETGVSGTDAFPPAGGTGSGTTTQESKPEPKPEPLPVLTDAVPLPRAAGDFQPPYPPQLLRTNVEGKAVVRVLIGADGRVKQVAIISADDPLFADATERQALRKWRFKPATRDGQPVESWKQMTVRFEIRR
jgi:periplasmic protein TonB